MVINTARQRKQQFIDISITPESLESQKADSTVIVGTGYAGYQLINKRCE
ncbi:MAG: hypothetical protein ACJAXJ_004327 [Colwellia sp.]|jgi:hypothetical protein